MPDRRASSLEYDPRIAAFGELHVAALELYRSGIEQRLGKVPHFDPNDGGTGARILLLMETPGARGSPVRFVSRDNDTGTARNLRSFCDAAEFDRRDCVLWNAVPWIIHAKAAPNRRPAAAEIAEGVRLLPPLLDLLRALRCVVLAGRVAERSRATIHGCRPDLAVFSMPHPSPVYVNTSPSIRATIVDCLRSAVEQATR